VVEICLVSSWCWPYSALHIRERGTAVSTVPTLWLVYHDSLRYQCHDIARQLHCQSWPIELTQTYYIYMKRMRNFCIKLINCKLYITKQSTVYFPQYHTSTGRGGGWLTAVRNTTKGKFAAVLGIFSVSSCADILAHTG
jgi:hypothetical protein